MEGVEGGFWADLFRNIFGWVDSLIYGFIASVYNTFTNITNYTLINDEVLQTFNQRIYALIGIFMLFKLAFSLITYFISPDKFSDSKSGFGNLIQRVIISLVLLVLVPYIFNLAFKAQTYILRENIIANLILGGQYDNFDIKERQEMYANAGKNMAFTTLSAFMHPYDQNVLSMDKDELKKEYADNPDAVTHFETYRTAYQEKDINALVGWYKLNTKEDIDGYYLFSYTPLLSTVAGIMVLWILIVFCVDMGIRTVKLIFLQLIAPIPVIGYIDVNKGEKTFTSWVKECLSTYAEVFLKLLAIYFVIFLITLITSPGFGFFQYVIDENNQLNTVKVENPDFFAMALIIIGLLIFAQQVPKLIGDLFGIKFGDFSLNPMKKIGESTLIGAGVGGLIGAGATALGNYKTNRDLGGNVGSGIKSALGGVFTGGARGIKAGVSEKTMSGTIKSGMGVAAKSAGRLLEKANTTFWGRNISRMQQAAGIQTRGGFMEKQIKAYNDFTKNMSNLKSAAGKRLNKTPDFNTNITDKNGKKKSVNISQQRALVDALSNKDTSSFRDEALQRARTDILSNKDASKLSGAELQNQISNLADKYHDEMLQNHVQNLAEARSTLAQAENNAQKDIMKDMVRQFNDNELSSIDDADAIAALDAMKSALNDDPTWYSNLEHQYNDEKGNSYSTYTVDMADADTFVDQASAAVGKAATKMSTSAEYKQASANDDYAKSVSKGSK